MSGRFVLSASGDQFMFNLKAGNNETILTSELYTTHARAMGGIAAVRANAPLDERYDRRWARSDQPYFVLLAANREPIGTSETYSSPAACERGIDAVKAAAPTAALDDRTRR